MIDHLCEGYSMVLSIVTASEAAKCLSFFFSFMNFQLNAALDNLYYR